MPFLIDKNKLSRGTKIPDISQYETIQGLKELHSQLQKTPENMNNHVSFLQCVFKEAPHSLVQSSLVLDAMAFTQKYHVLPKNLCLEFLSQLSLSAVENKFENFGRIKAVFGLILKDFSCDDDLLTASVSFDISAFNCGKLAIENLRENCDSALVNSFFSSKSVLDTVLGFEIKRSAIDFERVKTVFFQRLSIPSYSADLNKVRENFCAFFKSPKDVEKADELIKTSIKLYEEVVNVFGQKLSKIPKEKTESRIFHWCGFLETLEQCAEFNDQKLFHFYEKALRKTNFAPQIFEKYKNSLLNSGKLNEAKKLFKKALKVHRNMSFCEKYLFFLEKQAVPLEKIENAVERECTKNFFNNTQKMFLKLFAAAFCVREYAKTAHLKEEARRHFDLTHRFLLKNKNEISFYSGCDILQYFSFVELKYFLNTENARLWCRKATEAYVNRVQTWLKWIKFEKYNGDIDSVRKLILEALEHFDRCRSKNRKSAKRDILRLWKKVIWENYTDLDLYEEDMAAVLRQESILSPADNDKRKSSAQTSKKSKGKAGSGLKKPKSAQPKRVEGKAIEAITVPSTAVGNTVFVVNVARNVKDKELSELFAHYGKIRQLRVPKNDRGIPRGYGYVEYSEKSSAARAIAELNLVKFHGKILSVQQSRSQENASKTVFVKNLPKSDCEEALKLIFGECGEIESIRRPRERNSTMDLKPFCYLSFTGEKSVEKALKMEKSKLSLEDKVLRVEKCLPTGADTKRFASFTKKGALSGPQTWQPTAFVPYNVAVKRKRAMSTQSSNGNLPKEEPPTEKNLTNEQFRARLFGGKTAK